MCVHVHPLYVVLLYLVVPAPPFPLQINSIAAVVVVGGVMWTHPSSHSLLTSTTSRSHVGPGRRRGGGQQAAVVRSRWIRYAQPQGTFAHIWQLNTYKALLHCCSKGICVY